MAKYRSFSKNKRRYLFGLCGGRCAYCGRDIVFEDLHVDHVVALSKGGSNENDNLLPACKECNASKGQFSIEEYRDSIQNYHEQFAKTNVKYRNAVTYGIITPHRRDITFYYETMDAAAGAAGEETGGE
jgi:5-methylcytosine-specific restriction endonuclease McrA